MKQLPVLHDLKLLWRLNVIKPSQAISCVKMALYSNVLEALSLPPSSGNDMKDVLCVLCIYITYAPSCTAPGQWD
jgi:hypothetical protein